MIYIKPLSEYDFELKSRKLEGIASLVRLGVPTVSNVFIVLPSMYREFVGMGKISFTGKRELGLVFESIKRQGKSVSLRNSIFEERNPALSYSVRSSLNLGSFDEFLRRIMLGYKKVRGLSLDPEKVEFCYLIQSFYSSEKCGILISENGKRQIFIKAILGQNSDLLIRGDVKADEYLVNKGTYRIAERKIAEKKFRVKKLRSGVKKVRVKKVDQTRPVLTNEQIIRLAKLSQVVERKFGPQEIEWAVLDSGEIIFQETKAYER